MNETSKKDRIEIDKDILATETRWYSHSIQGFSCHFCGAEFTNENSLLFSQLHNINSQFAEKKKITKKKNRASMYHLFMLCLYNHNQKNQH